ncbi:MAG TPA: PDZ domain-containing protein, partial [Dokdonella sp.]
MKRTLMYLTFALALPSIAIAAPPEAASPAAAPSPAATAHAPTDATLEASRKELAQLRAQMQALSRRMAELSIQLGDHGPRAQALHYIGHPDRAMAGVVLAGDKEGVRINAVTPDGPAARVGLRNGDIVTAIDDEPLPAGDPEVALDAARDRLGDLREGQEVRIAYRRGAQKGVVVFEAERRQAWNWPALMNRDPSQPLLPEDFNERIRADVERAREDARRAMRDDGRRRADLERARDAARTPQMRAAMERAREAMRFSLPWWGLNLAPVNADLGRYFGTDKGALVIAADADSLPGLRAGDVITRVGKVPVTRPEDVMRALRERPAGSDVEVSVLRERKTVALALKAPAFDS